MHEKLKQKLNDSVPQDVILSEMKKQQILKAAQEKQNEKKPVRSPKLLPAIVGIAVVVLAGLLGSPFVIDWNEQRSAVEEEQLVPQKLVVPGHEYPILVSSIYDDQREALIYTDAGKIYAYDTASGTKEVLVDLEEGEGTQEIVIEGDWLAWEVFSDNGYSIDIMNLETRELKTIETRLVFDLNINGDYLYYAGTEENEQPTYKSVNLMTLETDTFHEPVTEGSYSHSSIWKNKIVIPERAIVADEEATSFSIYDLETRALIGQFTLPFEIAENVSFVDNKIYAQLRDKEFTNTTFGFMDLETGEFIEIPTPDFLEYAVYGDYLALSETKGTDSSDLKLYKMVGKGLESVQAFSSIEERLVRPRFTDDGTLVVNGEAEDLAMYLLDVTE